jgi:hypothetical protein
MTKLYIEYTERQAILEIAIAQVRATPTYRLGQALWNEVHNRHPHIAMNNMMFEPDHYRFYNSTDEKYCIDYFFENF